jgi:hypothetical protein
LNEDIGSGTKFSSITGGLDISDADFSGLEAVNEGFGSGFGWAGLGVKTGR